MSHNDHIQAVCKYPAMYMHSGTLESVYAYLYGLDSATGCLTGFREWLIPRADKGDNMALSALVDMFLEDEECPQDQRIARLGELIDEFFQYISEHRGLTRVFVRYHAWLLTRSWYRPHDPDYIAPHDGVDISGSEGD